MLYEALTNASSSPSAEFVFNFRSGDKIELSKAEAVVLLEAGAIRIIEVLVPPVEVEQEKKKSRKGD